MREQVTASYSFKEKSTGISYSYPITESFTHIAYTENRRKLAEKTLTLPILSKSTLKLFKLKIISHF
jgi:hypothetical protein